VHVWHAHALRAGMVARTKPRCLCAQTHARAKRVGTPPGSRPVYGGDRSNETCFCNPL